MPTPTTFSATIDPKTTVKAKEKVKIKKPPMYKIIYINDSETTMEFVVATLIEYFDYTVKSAAEITELIHVQGSAVVAVMPYELAEQKGIEVTVAARAEGFPLQIKIEEE